MSDANEKKKRSIFNINIVEFDGHAEAFITSHPDGDKAVDAIGTLMVHVYNAIVSGNVEHARMAADMVVKAAEGVKKSHEVDRE